MNLKFIIDINYDSWIAYHNIKKDSKSILLYLQDIKKNQAFLRDVKKLNEKEGVKRIKTLISKDYKKLDYYLKKTLRFYQSSWNEINKSFFRTTEKITGHKWKYKIYYCVISLFHKGISSWGGNKIIRSWMENPYTMRKITAHELLISHLFTIFEEDFKEEKLSDKQKWAIAEISAWAITGLEKKMLKFWPWISEREKYPLDHNYPQLYKLQTKLKPLYLSKKNFKGFLEKAIIKKQ